MRLFHCILHIDPYLIILLYSLFLTFVLFPKGFPAQSRHAFVPLHTPHKSCFVRKIKKMISLLCYFQKAFLRNLDMRLFHYILHIDPLKFTYILFIDHTLVAVPFTVPKQSKHVLLPLQTAHKSYITMNDLTMYIYLSSIAIRSSSAIQTSVVTVTNST